MNVNGLKVTIFLLTFKVILYLISPLTHGSCSTVQSLVCRQTISKGRYRVALPNLPPLKYMGKRCVLYATISVAKAGGCMSFLRRCLYVFVIELV